MKYYNNPLYTMVSNRRCIGLFKFLFEHLEDFRLTVIPDGLTRSVYYPVFYPTVDYEYRIYRERRAYAYQQARKYYNPYVLDPLVPLESFVCGFKTPEVDEELCLLKLFIFGIQGIFDDQAIVHDVNLRCFKRQFGEFKLNIYAALHAAFPASAESVDQDLLSFVRYDHSADFRPVFAFIFNLIREKKLNWHYQEIAPVGMESFFKEIGRHWAMIQAERILHDNNPNPEDPELAELRRQKKAKKEDEEAMIMAMSIPQVVEAYFEVYGNWPQGYPPEEKK